MDYQLIPLAHEHLVQAAEIERLCWTPWRPREKSGSWPSSPWRSASPTPPPGPSTRSWDTSKRAFGETTMKIPGRTPSS